MGARVNDAGRGVCRLSLLLALASLAAGAASCQEFGWGHDDRPGEGETGLSSARSLDEVAWVAELPFDLDGGQVIVTAWLGTSGPYRVQLDTGVYPSVIDPVVAQAAGLAMSQPRGTVAGAGSESIEYRESVVPALRIGDHHLLDLAVIVAETRHLRLPGGPIDGTLGESFFRRRTVQIDYPERTVRLAPAGSLRHVVPASAVSGEKRTCRGVPLAIDVSGHAPRLLDAEIDGHPTVAWLDTGNSVGLVLSRSALRQLELGRLLGDAKPVEGAGTRGPFKGLLVSVPSLRVGPRLKTRVTTLLAPIGGVWVGNGFLEGLVLTLDYDQETAFLDDPQSCEAAT